MFLETLHMLCMKSGLWVKLGQTSPADSWAEVFLRFPVAVVPVWHLITDYWKYCTVLKLTVWTSVSSRWDVTLSHSIIICTTKQCYFQSVYKTVKYGHVLWCPFIVCQCFLTNNEPSSLHEPLHWKPQRDALFVLEKER